VLHAGGDDVTPIKVFFLEPTDRERQWLRRYRSSIAHKCAKTGSYCNAMFDLGEADVLYRSDGYIASREDKKPPTSDPLWPLKCDACGEAFTE
jgi:hypothetical protein